MTRVISAVGRSPEHVARELNRIAREYKLEVVSVSLAMQTASIGMGTFYALAVAREVPT